MDIINELNVECQEVLNRINLVADPSLYSSTADIFRKTILLSCCSYFETTITNKLEQFFSQKSTNCPVTESFVSKKAIKRQCHTYFEWDKNNVNKFLSLFGDEFKNNFETNTQNKQNIQMGMRNFMMLGRIRNDLVHRNYAAFPIEQTMDEIYALAIDAGLFVEAWSQELDAFREKAARASTQKQANLVDGE